LIRVYCSGLTKAHAAGSEDYALALQAAKREVRRQDKWAKPYDWATLVLAGPR
jgi:CHAT domain-containing protein